MKENRQVIGLVGPARSGKSTAANFIREDCNGTAMLAFADPMKELMRSVLGLTWEHLWGSRQSKNAPIVELSNMETWVEIRKRAEIFVRPWAVQIMRSVLPEKVDPLVQIIQGWLDDLEAQCDLDRMHFLTPVSTRKLMQEFGTTVGRGFDKNLWVDYARYDTQRLLETRHIRLVAIHDVRFLNEAQMIREMGGHLWFLGRQEGIEESTHVSETEMFLPEMQALITRRIDNSGSLDRLSYMISRGIDEVFER